MSLKGRCLGRAGKSICIMCEVRDGRMRCYSLGFEGFRVFGLEAVVELGWWGYFYYLLYGCFRGFLFVKWVKIDISRCALQ